MSETKTKTADSGLRRFLRAVLRKTDVNVRVTDLRSATELIEELREQDALQALREIHSALVDLNGLDWLGLKERIRTTQYLDDKSRPLSDEVIARLFAPGAADAYLLKALPVVTQSWSELSTSYQRCLAQFEKDGGHAEQVLVVSSRAMALTCYMLECMLYRHYEVGESTWRLLHGAYRLAEKHQVVGKRESETALTPGQWLMVAHLLARIPYGRMLPQEVRAVAEWLRQAVSMCQLTTGINVRRDALCVDLHLNEMAQGARRILQSEGHRGLVTDKLMQAWLKSPPLSGRPVQWKEIVLDIGFAWSGKPRAFRRRAQREKMQREVLLRHGVNDVLALLKSPDAALMEKSNHERYSFESWFGEEGGMDAPDPREKAQPGSLLIDQSAIGVAIRFPRQDRYDVPVGELVGIYSAGDAAPRIGRVARINRRLSGDIEVGIELLALHAMPIVVQDPQTKVRFEAIHVAQSANPLFSGCLLLPATRTGIDGVFLVTLGNGVFKARVAADATVSNARFVVCKLEKLGIA
ncbi:hypothetical protein HNQ59_001135 [Chitinivorax tropicus]|uniref:PilZ domain-containing protein n=1 Tax=Chitinivorax tropicus TaxID=714531 RepID=A0A840MK40_9PROT|nr:hypothetical protein [Chitinivorax tropicus]MBB5017865.1 hypothetical protein [Chitinivorax tropicus]